MRRVLLSLVLLASGATQANDLLVKLASPLSAQKMATSLRMRENTVSAEAVTDSWMHVQGNTESASFKKLVNSGAIIYTQPNFKFKMLENPKLASLKQNEAVKKYLRTQGAQSMTAAVDNPPIPDAPAVSTGIDPLYSKQWGMNDLGLEAALKINRGNKIIVAVIDTGVDYTHEDLIANIWRNPKEIPDNQIDDDNNGYVDDVIGWDFVSNDNKPYDLAATDLIDLLNGGNPGHGTHCAGNVGAAGNNGKGISGVAPNAQIMALRFLGGEAGGTTADAIKAIKYAVDNGAKVLSNSWGSEGDDPEDAAGNLALKEIITYAQDHDVLFIAAAGNGHQGVGYDNDTDAKPGIPASYDNENIISVAAIGNDDKLGSFSNWGVRTVDIAAPGVKVFSTTVSGKYSDVVIDLLGANWDGTSMACPHVAGAAALYWSIHPEKNWRDVKNAILNSAKPVAATQGKVASNGKLNVENLLKY